MQISLIVLAAMILVAGIVDNKAERSIVEPRNVLSLEDSVEEDEETSAEFEGDIEELEAEIEQEMINTEDDPVVETTSEPSQDFIYPGARIISNNEVLILETDDDPKVVTDWYKDTITQMGFSVRNFITTSSNGKILNKLAGGISGLTIEIQIERDGGPTTITVRSSSN